MKALFVRTTPTGTESWIEDLSDDVSTRVAQIHDHVGGLFECVGLQNGIMYVNEEGKLLGLTENWVLTGLAISHRAIRLGFDWIVGNAVITGPADDNGDETDIPKALIDEIYGLLDVDLEADN